MGPAPIGDGVEILGQGGVAEELGLLVLGVGGEGEGVVGGGGAAEDEHGVADVLADLGVGGRGLRGEGAEEARVNVGVGMGVGMRVGEERAEGAPEVMSSEHFWVAMEGLKKGFSRARKGNGRDSKGRFRLLRLCCQ